MLSNHETDEPVGAPPLAGEGIAAAGTYVTFDLAGQTLGVNVAHVREILDQISINRLPNTPHGIEGVVDIRGESIPIVDMGSQLGMPRMEDGEDTRIIVFELEKDGAVRPLGVLADRVRDVTQINNDEIEETPMIVGADWQSDLLNGFARHAGLLIFLLNVDRVFSTGVHAGELDAMYL